MSKFKVGDKVRIIKENKIGIITKLKSFGAIEHYLDIEYTNEYFYYERELELVEEGVENMEKRNISITNNKITFSSSSGGYDQYTEINLNDNTVAFKECSGAECWAREVTIEELEEALEIIKTRKVEVKL